MSSASAPVDVVTAVRDRQVTAGRQRVNELSHHGSRVLVIEDEMHDAQHRDRDWLVEVQRAPRLTQDRVRVVQVRLDVVGGTLRGAGEQPSQ